MRKVWSWVGCGAAIVGLLVVGMITVPMLFHKDPCDPALSFATELGLQLSDDDKVVTCEWHSSFPDSSGKVMVRTASHASRDTLLKQSGVTEEIERSWVSINDGPLHEDVRRPNLERSKQVYTATAADGDLLTISYDEGVESGLLLTVWALQV